MNYRSVADLANVIRENLHRLPQDVDLVVGIPRSGMLAASIIALARNSRLADLPGFLANIPLSADNTRQTRRPDLVLPWDAKHVLLVDDSISSGQSMALAMKETSRIPGLRKITTCAAYSISGSTTNVDVHLEVVEQPRVFEWNLMHREFLAECCVDIDGILCPDPTNLQNDDGSRYRDFLLNVPTSSSPTDPIGHLVTSRLERYRPETLEWLDARGVRFRQLHMLDAVSAAERRRRRLHATFKASVYEKLADSQLFIESDPQQALEIARLSGKPVLCYRTQVLVSPSMSVAKMRRGLASVVSALTRDLTRRLKHVTAREP